MYSGNFSSPYYPASYPGSWDCYWEILVPSGYRVKLEFHTLDLGTRGYDNLNIHDGSSSYSPRIGFYDGQYTVCTVYSTGTSLWFRFRAFGHAGYGGKGFYATYTAVPSYSKYDDSLSKLTFQGL